jgi:hypothetical protein
MARMDRRTEPFRRAALWGGGLAAAMALAAPARGDDGCGAFGWSVKREQAWFADPKLTRRPSGARLKTIDRAVDLALKPVKQVHFFLPPPNPPKAGSFAGEIAFFGVPRPGLYQVTLSQAAELDVFENGSRIKPAAVATAPQCAEAALSARYALQTGDLVLVQVSDASAASIKIGFSLTK